MYTKPDVGELSRPHDWNAVFALVFLRIKQAWNHDWMTLLNCEAVYHGYNVVSDVNQQW